MGPELSPPYMENLRVSKHAYVSFLVGKFPFLIPSICYELSISLLKNHSTGGRDKQ